jgi:hypothetical protein
MYRAQTAEEAGQALDDFSAGPWGQMYPMITDCWKRNWEHVVPYFEFPDEIRKLIYTTNAIEALHSRVRKSVQVRGHFPSDEAAMKLIWLVLRNGPAKWKSIPPVWHRAKSQLANQCQGRFIATNEQQWLTHKIPDSTQENPPARGKSFETRLCKSRSSGFMETTFRPQFRPHKRTTHTRLSLHHSRLENRDTTPNVTPLRAGKPRGFTVPPGFAACQRGEPGSGAMGNGSEESGGIPRTADD